MEYEYFELLANNISMVTKLTDSFNTINRDIEFSYRPPVWVIQSIDIDAGEISFSSNMSVFEKLGPFVGLCQACGMIPYTIKNDLDTKKFEKFIFSFKHFNTWWFLLILILQLLLLGAAPLFYKDLLHELSADRTVPITVSILTGTVSFSYLAQFLTTRWIILHYRQLRTAVEAVQEVERLFGDKFIAQHQSSVITRTVIGLILTVMSVILKKF